MDPVDFFISYADSDQAWARWLVWLLDGNPFTTFARYKDIRWGENKEVRTNDALKAAKRFIALLSPDYLSAPQVAKEWSVVTGDAAAILLPLEVKVYVNAGILGNPHCLVLTDLDEEDAKRKLTEGLGSLGLKLSMQRKRDP